MITTAWLIALLLQGLDPTIGGHVSRGDERNRVVMPEQRLEIEFSHRLHLEEGLGCLDCHHSVMESKKTKDSNVPPRTHCLECHDSAEIPWRWSEKPGREDSALSLPPAHLRFSHAEHVEQDGVTCLTCHDGVLEADLATREHLPSMETCLTCHDGASASNTCTTCHPKGRGGRVRTTFAEGVLKPDDHGVDFLKAHEVTAERDLQYCASCHAQEDCLSCHDGSIPPTFHAEDYLNWHPQQALANNPPCASCHQLERFCRDCHFRSQVRLLNPLLFGGGFHPPGWNGFPGPNHHAQVAKKNLASCVACHQQDFCISCHFFDPSSPRVHPPGWKGSAAERRLRAANLANCLKCHQLGVVGDPINDP